MISAVDNIVCLYRPDPAPEVLKCHRLIDLKDSFLSRSGT